MSRLGVAPTAEAIVITNLPTLTNDRELSGAQIVNSEEENPLYVSSIAAQEAILILTSSIQHDNYFPEHSSYRFWQTPK